MKKHLLLAIFVSLSALYHLSAQTTTLTFVGKSSITDEYIRLHRVGVFNNSQHWEEILYYPDTTLQMQASTGIEEVMTSGSVLLLQNVPNPFDGVTDFALQLEHFTQVEIEIYDINGRKVTGYNGSLDAGQHQFRATLTSPQTYLLSAQTSDQKLSIKMINEGHGADNSIIYLGSSAIGGDVSFGLRGTQLHSPLPFVRGDQMTYVGYTQVENDEYVSATVQQQQWDDELIALMFNISSPIVATRDVTVSTDSDAVVSSEVLADGNLPVTARGVCYSTSPYPTIADSHTTNGSGVGTYNANLHNLQPHTTYHVRAYATNALGTAYGRDLSFNTKCKSVTDVDGITYHAVQIGEQCWMRENLRTDVPGNNGYPNGDANNWEYGRLYSWDVMMNGASSSNVNPSWVQGICPDGWHVPSDAEWTQLTDYVSSQSEYCCGGCSDNIAKALASVTGWYSSADACAVGNDLSSNNATDFSALPAGNYDGNYYGFGGDTYFWSATELNSSYAYYRYLSYITADVYRNGYSKYYGFSVRCVFDGVLPQVTTANVVNITHTTASSGGEVTSDGSESVTARGVCWSTSQNPTTADSHTTDGSGTGSFSSSITGLTPNTTYYVRAYATNSVGTAYGEERSFTTNCGSVNVSISGNSSVNYGSSVTLTANGAYSYHWSTGANTASITVAPTVTTTYSVSGTDAYGCTGTASQTVTVNLVAPTVATADFTDYNYTSVTSGGEVTADGGANVTARGVCWSTSQNPTVSGSHTTDGSGTGSFSSNIGGLNEGTTYYVRAYATNSAGTSYGEEKQFRTWQSCGTVTDVDGNTYSTVQIGEQCWMRENLRTTKYADNTEIALGNVFSYDVAYWYYPNNDEANKATYGLLYNWPAVMRNSSSSGSNPSGVQGICPDGWHVPSDAEWTQLTGYVGSQSEFLCGGNTGYIGKALSSQTGWLNSGTCGVGNTPSSNNATGFSSLPAGVYHASYYSFGGSADFWSATEYGDSRAYHYYLDFYHPWVSRGDNYVHSGFSVRCVRGQGCNPVYGETSADACGSYSWHGQTYTQSGDYTWTGQTSNGCDSIVTLHLTIHPMPNVQISGNSSVNYGESLTLTASGADSYHWNTGATTASVTVAPTATTTYSVTGTTAAGCTGTASKTVTVNYLAPTVTTADFSNYNYTSVTSGGEVTADGGANITARGVCYSTSPNPTIADSHTIDGNDLGSFSSAIAGLNEGTTYYVRAYATNSAGTGYGEEKQFRTWQSCGTVTDIDNNTYSTIQIGEQCWMRENLRTTKKPNGTTISSGIWAPGSNSVTTYGRLYSWTTVMNGAPSSNATPSGVQGICPDGWHVPSEAEWTQLTDYVSSQSEYCCDGNSGNIAKALASTTGWSSSTYTCAVGNDPSSNNATGFSALPAGNYYSSYYNFGYDAIFWSATERSSDDAYRRGLYYGNAGVDRDSYTKSLGYSVRCVRGQGCNPVYGETSAAACGSYTWHGQTYTQSGDYTWTGTTANGCDSVVTLHLTINTPTHVATTVTECESYVWNGIEYTQSGNYTFSHTDANGCTQVDTLHLTINQPTAESLNVTVTENSLPYHLSGYTYNAAGSYTQHLTNAAGCDSTLMLNLTVLNNVSVSVDSTICDGDLPLIWNGMTFNNAGSQSVTLTSANNTDSVVLMTLHVNASAYANEEVTLCESQLPFTWHGQTYTESGDYTWTGQTANGCDSIVTLHLTINNPAHQAITVTECESYAWNGTTYTQSGHYTYSHVDANGCTQVDTLHLTIPPTTVFAHTADTIVPAGVPTTLWTSGANFILWKDSHGNVIGEENTITVYPDTITTYSVIAYNTGANLVTNGDFEQGNTGFSTSYIFANTGNYKHYFIGQDNHQMWSWDEGVSISDHTSASGNWMMVDAYSGYTVWEQTVNVQPNTDYIFSAWFVTDNIANVRFEINGVSGELFSTPEERGIWRRHHLLWNSGDNASAQLKIVSGSATSGGNDFGVDDISFAPITTCENTEVIFVTTLPAGDALPCMGHETVTDIDGNTYNTVQIGDQCWMRENLRTTRYADNSGIALGNANSYDIAYRYIPNNNSQNIPQYGYLYNWAAVMHGGHSNNDNPSGVQGICPDGWHVPSSNEWDQLISYVSSVPYYCCNGNSSYIVKALASQVGWNYQGGSCSVGSDLATNNLTGFSAMPACYFYDTHGSYFGRDASFWSCTQTGSNKSRSLRIYSPYSSLYYDINLDQAHGLSVRCIRGQGCNPVHSETSAAACETYTWHGQTYTQSGDYTWTGQTSNGCDSVVTLHLTINQPTAETLNVTVTENSLPYHLNGYAYNAAGSYTQHLTNANGCDSTLFVNLTVLNNVSVSVDSTICDGDLPLIWNGMTFNIAGSQSVTLTSANNTDSVVLMTLHVNESVYSNEEVTLCESQLPFSWHGQTYTESGDYIWTGQTANGCDSIVTLHLTINQPTNQTFNESACDSYIWHGQIYTESGTYTYVQSDNNGCIQVDTLNLTINHSPVMGISCSMFNESVIIFSDTLANDCSHTFTYFGGASHFPPSDWGLYSCPLDNKDFTVTATNEYGCSTTDTFRLIVNTNYEQVCEGEIYEWNGEFISESGNYYRINKIGGDFIVDVLDLTIFSVPNVNIEGVTDLCVGGQVTLTAHAQNVDGNSTYWWLMNNVTIEGATEPTYTTEENLPVGEYMYSVFVENYFCPSVASIVVTVHPAPEIEGISSSLQPSNQMCEGGTVDLRAPAIIHFDAADIQWHWFRNGAELYDEQIPAISQTLDILGTYAYMVYVTQSGYDGDIPGCQSAPQHINIDVLPQPVWGPTEVTPTDGCLRSWVELRTSIIGEAQEDAYIVWHSAPADFPYAERTVVWLPLLYSDGYFMDTLSSPGELIYLPTYDGYFMDSLSSPGRYIYWPTYENYSNNNCWPTNAPSAIAVTVHEPSYQTITESACGSYTWHGQTYTQSGDYTWTGTTANGCDSVVTLHLTIHPMPNVQISGSSSVNYGSSVTLTASGADSYYWNTGANTASVTVAPTAATTYSVTGTTAAGCTGTASINVEVNELTLNDGLVLYLPMNGDLMDVSGFANNGTNNGASLTTDRFCQPNSAYEFPGVPESSKIIVPNNSSLQFSDAATFSMWFCMNGTRGMDGWGGTVDVGCAHALFSKNSDMTCIGANVSAMPNGEFHIGSYSGRNSNSAGDTCELIQLNQWVQATFVFTTSYMEVYVNGELLSHSDGSMNFGNSNSKDLSIGLLMSTWYPFNGKIDEFRVYNRALNASEIAKLYYRDLIPKDSLVLFMPLDGNVIDHSDNNYQPVLHGNLSVAGDRFGVDSSAYHFPNDYRSWIEIPHSEQLNLSGTFTVSAWYNRAADGEYGNILSKGRDIESGWQLGTAGISVNGSNGYSAGIQDDLTREQWYMTTGVMDAAAGKLRYYLNGELMAETNCPNFSTNTTFPLAIGRHLFTMAATSSYAYPFKGEIDDIVIYHRALSDDEVMMLYKLNTHASPSCEEPIICEDVYEILEYEGCQGDLVWFNEQVLTETGTYIDTFRMANGCDSIVMLHLTINPMPNVQISGSSSVNYGESVTLTASGASSYIWSTGSMDNPITVSPTSTTTYNVIGATTYGCTGTASKTVTVNPVAPTVTTAAVSNITANSAACGGNVTSDGGANVTARGVCWSTSQNPTVSDSHTTAGSGTGSFSSSIAGLTLNTTYYVRAYATNSVGTSYGEERSFTAEANVPSSGSYSITTCDEWIYDCGGSSAGYSNYCDGSIIIHPDASASVVIDEGTYNVENNWDKIYVYDGEGTAGALLATLTNSGAITTPIASTTGSLTIRFTSDESVTRDGFAFHILCANLPSVTTAPVLNITANSAACGGNVTSDGGANVTARGVCWSTSHNPTIAGSHTTDGSGLGGFSSNITGLTPSTTYYVRAYATNALGTSYGEEKQFRTANLVICPNDLTLSASAFPNSVVLNWAANIPTEIITDTLSYHYSRIGGATQESTISFQMGMRFPVDSLNNLSNHYLTHAGVFLGTLPEHLSLHLYECIQNGDVVTIQQVYSQDIPVSSAHSFSYNVFSLASPYLINPSKELMIGFELINVSGACIQVGEGAHQAYSNLINLSGWTIMDNVGISGYSWIMDGYFGDYPISYRVYRDNEEIALSESNAQYVDSDDFTEGQEHCYHIEAVCNGGVVSNTVCVTIPPQDGLPCVGNPIITDYDANTYSTVQIGEQCWMRENMRTTHYTDGTPISVTTNSYNISTPYAYYPDNNPANASTYGLLYNWRAAMGDPELGEDRKSVCPTGWHIPSEEEVFQLNNYLRSNPSYWCGGNSSYVSHVLAANSGWNTSTTQCAPGFDMNQNNATNLSIMPSGYAFNPIGGFGGTVYMWTSDEVDENRGAYYEIAADNPQIGLGFWANKSGGLGVRCLRDPFTCGTSTVTDIDGNEYHTVQIGDQCWMRENLRTDVPGNNGYPNNDANNWEYGRLYSWDVMMNGASSSNANPSGVQGICPDGWHVPSDAEWKQMEMAAGMSQSDADNFIWRGNIAAKLCGNTGWYSSSDANAAGNTTAPNRNSTGFSALPAGNYRSSYSYFGEDALFWSATEYSSDIAYYRSLAYFNAGVNRSTYDKTDGYSVRCVRD